MTTHVANRQRCTVVLGSGLFTCSVDRDTPIEVQQLLNVMMKHLLTLSTQQRPVTDQESYDSFWVTRRSQVNAVVSMVTLYPLCSINGITNLQEDILKLQLLLGGPQSMHLSPSLATHVGDIEALAPLLEVADKATGLYFGPSIHWETVSEWISRAGTSSRFGSGDDIGRAGLVECPSPQVDEHSTMCDRIPPTLCKDSAPPDRDQYGTIYMFPQPVELETTNTDQAAEPTKVRY